MRTYLIKYKNKSFEMIVADWAVASDGTIAFGVGEFAPFYWLNASLFDAVREVTGFSEEQIDAIKRKLAKPRDVIIEQQPEPVLQLSQRDGLGKE
jgi:hypothetical protein